MVIKESKTDKAHGQYSLFLLSRVRTRTQLQSIIARSAIKVITLAIIMVLFILAAVTSGLLIIVKTGITIVSYFGNVTASLFALTIVRKFTPR